VNIESIINSLSLPVAVINKKKEVLFSNKPFRFLDSVANNILSDSNLSERLETFIKKPENFLVTFNDFSIIENFKTTNKRFFDLVVVLSSVGYKITHLTSVDIKWGINEKNISLLYCFILRVVSPSSKNKELFFIIFDIDIFDIIKQSVVDNYRSFDEADKKYSILLQVTNRVFSVVKGFIDTIMIEKYKDLDLIYNLLDIVNKEVSYGMRLLLSFNLSDRIENFSYQFLSTYDFLYNFIGSYKEKLISENLRLKIKDYIQPNIPNLYTDISKLEVCLHNLLDNAIRYRDENKEESIISFNAYFESSSNEIVIVIEDNGIGMSEEELQQLGQVFKTFSDKSGIGLGMYIVKKIVDIMKWNIKIESKKGVFTKIVLSIPLINKVD